MSKKAARRGDQHPGRAGRFRVLRFTFLPKKARQASNGAAPKPISDYMVSVHGHGGELAYNWSESPAKGINKGELRKSCESASRSEQHGLSAWRILWESVEVGRRT